MFLRSCVDVEVKIGTTIAWLTTGKFKRRSAEKHYYLILEYIKTIKDPLFFLDVEHHHKTQIFEFCSDQDDERQRSVRYTKKIGDKIISKNSESDLFENLEQKTFHKIKFEISPEQRKLIKRELRNYTETPTNLDNLALHETDIKDTFYHASSVLNFLSQTINIQLTEATGFSRPSAFRGNFSSRANTEKDAWDELTKHVVLVHAINQEGAFDHGINTEAAKELGITFDDVIESPRLKVISSIIGALTSHGVIGHHIDFEHQQFKEQLIDRPHLHWCWNMLVEPNAGGNWENSLIAILEPLNAFESERGEQLFGIAPYDTLTIGKHQLSKRSILLIPDFAFEVVRKYLSGFKGRIVTYDPNATPIRNVITRVLNRYYPNIWHMCDQNGNLISDSPSQSITGYRSVTCMKQADGKLLKLIQGEKRAQTKAMKMGSERRRFLGLHLNSETYLLEDSSNAYFATLKKFKTNRERFKDNPLFAGNVTNSKQLRKMGSLYCLTYCKGLLEYSPATGTHQLADYLMNEALYADIVSICYKNVKNDKLSLSDFSYLDFSMLIMQVQPFAIDYLQKIKIFIDSADPESGKIFNEYRNFLLKALQEFKDSQLILKNMLYSNGTDATPWLRKSCIFMGYFEDEFEILPLLIPPSILCIGLEEWNSITQIQAFIDSDSLKMQLGNTWPLEDCFQKYIHAILKALPNDVDLLARLHFLLHVFVTESGDIPVRRERSSLDSQALQRGRVIQVIIEWVIQEKIFREPAKLLFPFSELTRKKGEAFADNISNSDKKNPSQRFIFTNKLFDARLYYQCFKQRRERVLQVLKEKEIGIDTFIALQYAENEIEQALVTASSLSRTLDAEPTDLPQGTFLNQLSYRPSFTRIIVPNIFRSIFLDPSEEVSHYRREFQSLRNKFPSFALFDALSEGNEKEADKLFKKYSTFFEDINFRKLIPCIAFQNNYVFLRFLAKKNVPLNIATTEERPLVLKIVDYHLYDAFEGLISSPDFQINAKYRHGNTILHEVILTGDLEACRLLTKNRELFVSILNKKNSYDFAPLDTAFLIGRLDIAKYLMSFTETNFEPRACKLSYLFLGYTFYTKEIPAGPAPFNSWDSYESFYKDLTLSKTPYYITNIKYLHKNGQLLAIMRYATLKKLRKNNHLPFFGFNNKSDEQIYLDSVQELLANPEVDVNRKDHLGNTALHYAASLNYSLVVRALLKWQHGRTDPNLQNNQGKSPTHLAQKNETIRILVNHGAIPFLKDNQGKTPHDRATEDENSDLEKCLKECEAYFRFSVS